MTTSIKLRRSATNNPYLLNQDDMNAFQSILQAQGHVGPAQQTVSQARFWNFFGVLNDMAYDHYRLTNNPNLKNWILDLFNVVMNTKTSYMIDGKNLTGAGLYLMYMYYRFNDAGLKDSYYEPEFPYADNCYPDEYKVRGGTWLPMLPVEKCLSDAWPWNWFGPGATSVWMAPTLIPSFYDALTTDGDLLVFSLAETKGSTQTVMISGVGPSHTLAEIQAFQQSRLDPVNWTNSGDFVHNIAASPIWSSQVAVLKTLLTAASLDSSSYLFVLHLLIAVSASNATDQALAQTLLNTTTSSLEYPNDTFINTMVYLVMMQFRDPLGDYGYNDAMLSTAIADLQKTVVATNPASKIITTALNKHAKILNSDASYPMQDPYNPGIGFDTRLSDIIDALDEARSTMTFS